ncbi:hypothetical protein MGAST_14595 [Mycobacterium gastri 'Wayne']|uniref:PIN domain-containing protein n=1 Tax=Mycobacterium gastri TaxID=1777 RepID=A0A1X1VY16_MYCGS|nr:hypothetical protein MGAST_14595 [Mycobacterium gastri 'Wayne']ORV74698.1 hypothetical protein AWC07_24035 [Mycobacterium gastri]
MRSDGLDRVCRAGTAAIGRPDRTLDAINAYSAAAADDVLPIGRADVEHAKHTLLRYPALSARDALHVAVMARHHIAALATKPYIHCIDSAKRH